MGAVKLVALALLLSGCFDPDERDGALECGPGGACPVGFVCGRDDRCWREGDGDGDSDSDGDVDGPDAASPVPDARAAATCANGLDDDCDGVADDDDPGCRDNEDPSERGSRECDDGEDNDDDGRVDFGTCTGQADPSCDGPDDDREEGGG